MSMLRKRCCCGGGEPCDCSGCPSAFVVQHNGDYGDLLIDCVFAGGTSVINAILAETLSSSGVMQRVGETCFYYTGIGSWQPMTPVSDTVCGATTTWQWKLFRASATCDGETGKWLVSITALAGTQPDEFHTQTLGAGFQYETDGPEQCPDGQPRSVLFAQTFANFFAWNDLPIQVPGTISIT